MERRPKNGPNSEPMRRISPQFMSPLLISTILPLDVRSSEDGCSRFLRNVDKCLSDYTPAYLTASTVRYCKSHEILVYHGGQQAAPAGSSHFVRKGELMKGILELIKLKISKGHNSNFHTWIFFCSYVSF
jgi:hypothetical protein